jgi:hypothetical protein
MAFVASLGRWLDERGEGDVELVPRETSEGKYVRGCGDEVFIEVVQ